MNIIVYSLLLLLASGCATQTVVPIQTNAMNEVQVLPAPTSPVQQPLVKPSVAVKHVDGKSVAVLEQKGMADLIDLYRGAVDAQKTVQSQHQVLAAVVAERNNLLMLARQQEQVANQLRQQLATQNNQSNAREQQQNIELYCTRALLLLSIAAGL